jgi:hypothetical protein
MLIYQNEQNVLVQHKKNETKGINQTEKNITLEQSVVTKVSI